MTTTVSFLAFALLTTSSNPKAGEDVTVSAAKKDTNGFLVHEVRSPYQAGVTHIRVLLPDKLEPGKCYPVV
jgi:hypothetical protein